MLFVTVPFCLSIGVPVIFPVGTPSQHLGIRETRPSPPKQSTQNDFSTVILYCFSEVQLGLKMNTEQKHNSCFYLGSL